MTFPRETLAARILVLRKAEQVASRRDEDQVFGYFTGQRDAYEKVYGDAYTYAFPEERTLSENVDEELEGFTLAARAEFVRSAIRSVEAGEYVTVGSDGYPHVCDHDCDPGNCEVAHHNEFYIPED